MSEEDIRSIVRKVVDLAVSGDVQAVLGLLDALDTDPEAETVKRVERHRRIALPLDDGSLN